MLPYADLAQLVEHMPEEHSVLGSTPRVRTIYSVSSVGRAGALQASGQKFKSFTEYHSLFGAVTQWESNCFASSRLWVQIPPAPPDTGD